MPSSCAARSKAWPRAWPPSAAWPRRCWLTCATAWRASTTAALAVLLQDGQSAEEQRTIEQAFYRRTGWTPAITHHVAGALKHPEQDYLKRLIMRLIAKHQGGDADTSRAREYTDWDDLTRYVDAFLAATSQQESGHRGDNYPG